MNYYIKQQKNRPKFGRLIMSLSRSVTLSTRLRGERALAASDLKTKITQSPTQVSSFR